MSTAHDPRRNAPRVVALFVLSIAGAAGLVLSGCPGRLDDIERYRPKDGVFVCPDIPTMFVERCAQGTCHGAENPAGSLDLVSADLGARLVEREKNDCPGTMVIPSDPTSSLLYRKMSEATPACGFRMPVGGTPLSEDELACVEAWIASLEVDAGGQDAGCPQCICEPGAKESCYGGPAGTEGVGICKAGTRTCNPEGLTWGPCEGEVLPAVEECLTPEDEDCDGNAPGCPVTWSRSYGDALTQYARSVGADANGNVYFAGDFEGEVDFGGGPLAADGTKSDIFVVKLDQYGNHVWSRRFGDASSQYLLGIAVDPSGAIALTGRVFGSIDFGGGPLDAAALDDVFVAKLDTDGNHVWSRVFGDNLAQRGENVAFGPSGEVVVVGQFAGTLPVGATTLTSAGVGDAFVFELAGATGDPVYAASLGGAGDDRAHGVSVDAAGNAFVVGSFSDTATIGATSLTSAGLFDGFIAKITAAGDVAFANGFGGTGDDVAFDVAVDPANGDAVLAGSFSGSMSLGGPALVSAGSRDIFLSRLTSAGNHVFSKGFGDATDQLVSDYESTNRLSLAIGPSGSTLLTGPLSGSADFGGGALTSAGKTDVLLARFDAAGAHVFSKLYGGAGTQVGLDVAASGPYAVVCGRLLSSADFGFGLHTSAGDSDAFVAKVQP